MYAQSYDNLKQVPKVITYPNKTAIIEMARKNSENNAVSQSNNGKEIRKKAEQDENLTMLILTLLLSHDIESSGIEYLIAALMFIL